MNPFKTIIISVFFLLVIVSLILISCSEGTEPDTEPPTVWIMNPDDGRILQVDNSPLVIRADAEDNDRVEKVEFFIDGIKVHVDEETPYEYEWDYSSADGSHTIMCKAFDPAGNSGNSEIISVEIEEILPKPVLISPVNGDTLTDNTPQFNWNSVIGDPPALEYVIIIDRDGDFDSLIYADTVSSTTHTIPYYSSLSSGIYYWRVRGRSTAGYGIWSDTWVFYLSGAPQPPELSYPLNDSIINNPVSLFWHPVSSISPVEYELKVATSPSFLPTETEIFTSRTDTNYTHTSDLTAGTYYWKVKAENDDGESDWSEIWNFRLSGIPDAPVLVSPSDEDLIADTTPIFAWNAVGAVPDVDYYEIEVDNSSSFTSLEYSNSSITATRDTIPDSSPLSEGTYYWHIRAHNSIDWGNWSDVYSFTISSVPGAPVLITPEVGDSLLGPIIYFDWSMARKVLLSKIDKKSKIQYTDPPVDTYNIRVSANPSFSPTVLNVTTDISEKDFNISGFSSGLYYWKVRAHNELGWSEYSDSSTFHYIGSPPGQPTLNSPADLYTTADSTPTFSWYSVSADPTVDYYQFQIDQTTSFGSPEYVDTTTSLSLTIPTEDMLLVDTYYWQVRAHNSVDWGDWSPYRTIFIKSVPDSPTPISPPNDTTISEASHVVFRWEALTADPAVDSFRVQLDDGPSISSPFLDLKLGNTTVYMYDAPSITSGAYYWRISARNSLGWGEFCLPWHFDYELRPPEPIIVSPTTSDTLFDSLQTFMWDPVTCSPPVDRYWFQASTDAGFSAIIASDSMLTSSFYTSSMPADLIYWRVKAHNHAGWSDDWASTWFVRGEVPGVPVPIFPVTGDKQQPNMPVFVWNSIAAYPPVTHYEFKFCNLPDTGDAIISDTTSDTTFAVRMEVSPVTTHYWFVRACVDDECGDWTTAQTAELDDYIINTLDGFMDSTDLNGPNQICLSPDENYLYVANAGRHIILRYSLTLYTAEIVAGVYNSSGDDDTGPAIEAHLNSPKGVTVTSDGTIYICDSGNHKIKKVRTDGNIQTIAGTGDAGYEGDGGPALTARLNNPSYIYYQGGVLYFSDYSNNRFRKIEGTTIDTFANKNYPVGMFFADSGVYLCNGGYGNDRVVFLRTGTTSFITVFGGGSESTDYYLATSTRSESPQEIVFRENGDMIVIERPWHKLRRIDHITNRAARFAGTGSGSTSGDGGAALDAGIPNPNSIVYSPSRRTIYFSQNDWGDYYIRYIECPW